MKGLDSHINVIHYKEIDSTNNEAKKLINGQKDLHLIQNKNSILFCGSYFGYGFHEDGIKSSIDMIKYINA